EIEVEDRRPGAHAGHHPCADRRSRATCPPQCSVFRACPQPVGHRCRSMGALDEVAVMTPPRPAPPLKVRTEADVLALVPFTLGFHPEHSLVLITLTGSGRPFHARID